MSKTIQTLLWEFWHPNKWRFVMAFFAMWIMPGIMTAANVRSEYWESFSFSDLQPLHWSAQMVAIWFNLLICTLTVGYAVGFPKRHYTLPISIRQLVWIRLIPGALTCAILYLLFAALFNGLFNSGFPSWEPALTYGLGYMLGYALVSRFYERENLRTLAAVFVGYVALVWIFGHYESLQWNFGTAIRWPSVTVFEAAIIVAMALVCWWITESGFGLDRRGRGWSQPAIRNEEAESPRNIRRHTLRRFRSPFAALFWQEWRQDGWVWPIGLAGLLAIIACIILIASAFSPFHQQISNPDGPVEILTSTVAFMWFAAFLPWFLGTVTSHGRKSQVDKPMATAISTLPISDATLAWVSITRSLASVVLCWLLLTVVGTVWAIVYSLCYHEISWSYPDPTSGQPSTTVLGLWCVGWLVFFSWFTTGVGTATGLSGRRWILLLPIAFIPIWMGSVVGVAVLERSIGGAVVFFALTGLLLALITGTCVAYFRTWRRKIIGWKTILLGEAILLIVQGTWWTAINVAWWSHGGNPQDHFAAIWGVSLFLALAVAPPAIVPLSVHYNRHR